MTRIEQGGFRVREVPVHHFHRAYGQSQFFNFGRVARTLPTVAIAHARRSVQQHYDFARPTRRARHRAPMLEERARERRGQKREGEAAEHEQENVPQLLPAHRPIRDPLQEHQRRKLHDRATLAVNQVNEHRN